MPNLLIAVSPQDTQLVHSFLGDEFNLLICHTFPEAETRLTEDICLVICGVHFDQGRMFDLIQLVRSKPELLDMPFVFALGREVKYSSPILQGIETAAKSLGATAFINVLELVSSMGKKEAYEDIRRTVRKILLTNSMDKSIRSSHKAADQASDGRKPHAS